MYLNTNKTDPPSHSTTNDDDGSFTTQGANVIEPSLINTLAFDVFDREQGNIAAFAVTIIVGSICVTLIIGVVLFIKYKKSCLIGKKCKNRSYDTLDSKTASNANIIVKEDVDEQQSETEMDEEVIAMNETTETIPMNTLFTIEETHETESTKVELSSTGSWTFNVSPNYNQSIRI